MIFECLKIVLSRIKTLIMKLNQDRTLNYINSFRLDEKYTDTVLKFSDGHIYVHWMILEAHGMVQSGGPLPETLIVIILLR